MTSTGLVGVRARLEEFLIELFAGFARSDQRSKGELYVRGLMMDGRRKSMEPMASRLGVDRQGLQQFLTDSTWSHQQVLRQVALRMEQVVAPAAWVVDDVSFPKDGKASPGVAAQYCGALGKTANCQVAPSVHLATDAASAPVDWRLFLPAEWDPADEDCADPVAARRRRAAAHVPDDARHIPKWQLALDMVDELIGWGLAPPRLLVADEGYGQDGEFRLGLEARHVRYVVGVRSDTAVLPATAERITVPWSGNGRRPVPRYRDKPMSVAAAVTAAGRSARRRVVWRTGSKGPLASYFVALRVRPAGVRIRRAHPGQDLPECWLLAEWPARKPAPTKFWLSTLPAEVPLRRLVRLAKIRWRIEHDYRELKQALGLAHFEGRTWNGWHHHVVLVTVAHAFVTCERLHPKPAAPA
jgi:SRSO17 transposase